jgi:hypothetical protein
MGYMEMGGTRLSVPGGTTPYRYSGYDNSDQNLYRYVDMLKRKQAEEEARRQAQRNRGGGGQTYNFYGGGAGGGRGGYAEEIMKNIFGSPGYTGAPQGSEFAPLNYSYKTRGRAPDYHREMPLGGTPGVWAIRNDELFGPRGNDWSGLAQAMRDRNRRRLGFGRR